MEYYWVLLAFTLSTSITPGPNNLMLLASGLNHGVKGSLPHYFGITLGFCTMVILVGSGLGSILIQFPSTFLIIKVLGASYLVFLAWKIANASRLKASVALKRPLSFVQAAVFQYVNPKAWIMAVGSIATFTVQDKVVESIATVALAYFLTGLFSQGVRLLAGQNSQRFLRSQRALQSLNITMAILLVVSIVPMVF